MTSTVSGTLAAGASKTFGLLPAETVTLTLSPNVRVVITETPAAVSGSGVGGASSTRVHRPELPGTFTYGPYAMGGSVVVEVQSNSGSSVGWTITSTYYGRNSSGDVTSLVDGDGNALPLGTWGTPAIAVMGDSIAQQNSSIITSTYTTNARGPVMWMLSYLGHPWDFQPSDNFAVAGTTLDVILANQLAPLLAAHAVRRYARVFISAGTNDTNSARAIADIKADFSTLFARLRAVGIMPVTVGIRPRGIDVAMTTAKKQNQALNEWLYLQSLSGLIEYIPVGEVYADTSTAFGNAVAALMYDGGTSALHPSARGAALEGRAMATYYQARGIGAALPFASQQSDAFDRTDNPGGVAFASANPLLIGGTTTPTGMTTSGGTWSNVGRTLANGQTRADRSCALAASTTHYLYDDWTKTGAWAATDLQPGDIIEGRALVVLTSAVNVNSVCMRLAENDGAGALTHYALYAAESANLQGDHVLYLRTPRVPVRNYSGSGNVSIFARADIVTDSGGSGTAIVRQMEVRKVA